jgi:hypothetical protein
MFDRSIDINSGRGNGQVTQPKQQEHTVIIIGNISTNKIDDTMHCTWNIDGTKVSMDNFNDTPF